MENVKFDDWQKLDLRTGKIISVEDIEGADKLYKLTIDLGSLGKRTIAAGLKPFYKQEELEGRNCVIFANLEPRMLRGVESQGMLLAAASEDEKTVRLLTPDGEIELGSKIR